MPQTLSHQPPALAPTLDVRDKMKMIGIYLIASGIFLGFWGADTFFQTARLGSSLRSILWHEAVQAHMSGNPKLHKELEQASAEFEKQAMDIMNSTGKTALGLFGVGFIHVVVGGGSLIAVKRRSNRVPVTD